MNKIFTILLIIFLTVINILLFLKYSQDTKSLQFKNFVLESDFKKQLVDFVYRDTMEKKSDFYQLNKETVLRGMDGKIVTIQQAKKKGPKLILRYSELNCTSCYQEQITNINEFVEQIGPENVIVFTTYVNPRELYNFKKANKIKSEIYNLEDRTLGLPLEKNNIPFLFILDDEYITKLTFVPLKSHPQLINAYFSLLKDRFFDGSKRI